MKTLLNLAASALLTTFAMLAINCSRSGTGANMANSPLSAQPANAAAPVPASSQNPEDAMPRISVEETKKLVADGKAIIIDVRGTDSYKMEHVKGAIDFPLSKIQEGDFKGLPKDK